MKFKELYTEGNFDNIAKLTDYNDHTGARIEGAKILKDKKLEDVFKAIEVIHSYFGHLPSSLSTIRSEMDKKMFAIAKKKLGKDYESFHDAF